MSEKAITRNKSISRYGTFTNGQPALQIHRTSVQEKRLVSFRETLRNLVRRNEATFGKTYGPSMTKNDEVQLVRDH